MESPAPLTSHRVTVGENGEPTLVKVAGDEGGRARLAREAEVLRLTAHPGIVAVRDLVDEGETAELHLAWAGPHSLATVTGVPAPDAAALVARVCDVVAHLHGLGLAHGRLTPDHVLLGSSERVVLTGLAEALPIDGDRAAADVAELGALLSDLVRPLEDRPMFPERRLVPRHDGIRGALLTLADRAQAEDARSRPSATELAGLLRAVAPEPRPRAARHRRLPAKASTRADNGHDPMTIDRTSSADEPDPRVRVRTRQRRWARIVVGAWHSSSRRNRFATIALAVAALVAVSVTVWAVSDSRASAPVSSAAVPASSTPDGRQSTAPVISTSAPSTEAATTPPSSSVPGTPTTGCPPVDGFGADVDGDGCPEWVRVVGERVTVGSTTWVVGEPGDALTVGDWDCDTIATVAAFRPSTGEVFVFDRWVPSGDELTVRPAVTVPDAVALVATDTDGDGCSSLALRRRDGSELDVPVAMAR